MMLGMRMSAEAMRAGSRGRRKAASLWLAAFSLATLIGPAPAADEIPVPSSVRLECEIDSTSITVGSVARLTVSLHYPPDLTPGPVVLPADLGDFVVRDFREISPKQLSDREWVRVTQFDLTSYAPGELAVRGPEVSFMGAGGEWHRVMGDSLHLLVASVLPDSTDPSDSLALRDIQELAAVPGPGFPWRDALIIGGAAAVIAALLFWLLRRRRRKRKTQVEHAPSLPPWEEARQALAALAARDLPARGELEIFYVELTAIVRRYLGARFGFPALDMTTMEIMSALRAHRGPTRATEEALTLARRMLEGADLVKFARGRPPTEAAREDTARAERLISATEPPAPVLGEPLAAGSGSPRGS